MTLAPKALKPGTNKLTLKYLGTSVFAPSTSVISVLVTKPKPKVKVKVDKTVDKGDKTKVVVKVNAPDDIKVKGKIKLVIKGTGKTFTAKVVDGKAVFKLPASTFTSVGKYTLKGKYLGSDLLQRAGKSVNIEVSK